MRKTLRVMLSILLLWSTLAWANPPLDKVASLIENDAVVVVHIDLDAFDFDVYLKTVAAYYGDPQSLAEPQDEIRKNIDALKQAGAESLFGVISMRDITTKGPYLLATLQDPENADAVSDGVQRFASHAMVPYGGEAVHQRVGDIIVCGHKDTVSRVKDAKSGLSPERLTEIRAALEAVKPTGMQVAFVPTPDTRVAIAQMAPALPEALSDYTSKDVLDGVQWASISLATNNGPSVTVNINSKDEPAATKMLQLSNAAMDWTAKGVLEELGSDRLGDIMEVRKLLTPVQDGRRLVTHVPAERFAAIQKLVVEPLQERVLRLDSMNQLRSIALSMLNFESAWGAYPPHASYDDHGKPLLSWRVYVLPYMEENELYERFHLDEPWDSEHNRKLIPEMPVLFRNASKEVAEGKTTYLAPYGKQSVFFGQEGTPLRTITDGTSKTILVVDAAPEKAVTWTQPVDWKVDLANPFKGMLGDRKEFSVVRCDGSAQVMSRADTNDAKMKAFLTKNGGEVIDE